MNRKSVIKRERSPACMNIGERERFIQVTKKEEKMSAWHKNYNFWYLQCWLLNSTDTSYIEHTTRWSIMDGQKRMFFLTFI